MGNFDSRVNRGVRKIGNHINNYIDWWYIYKDSVDGITIVYVTNKKNLIKSADNPKLVGKFFGVNKEKKELDEKSRQIYKQLSERDKKNVDKALENDDDF